MPGRVHGDQRTSGRFPAAAETAARDGIRTHRVRLRDATVELPPGAHAVVHWHHAAHRHRHRSRAQAQRPLLPGILPTHRAVVELGESPPVLDTDRRETAASLLMMDHGAHTASGGRSAVMSAMTCIHAMDERGALHAMRVWLVSHGFGLRVVSWRTGLLALCSSPLADALTVALFLGAVALATGGRDRKFVGVARVTIVLSGHAGVRDTTTLMAWQKGRVAYGESLPSASRPSWRPSPRAHQHLLPPGERVLTLGYLGLIAYWPLTHAARGPHPDRGPPALQPGRARRRRGARPLRPRRAAGGRLRHVPQDRHALIGILSAVVDDAPATFAVLTVDPDTSLGPWRRVTMTAGLRGTLPTIGSAGGVPLVGAARGICTFGAHLMYIRAVARGRAATTPPT